MKRMGMVFISAVAVAALAACQPADSPNLEKKLDDIDKRLASIDKKLESGARPGAARPQQPRRPRGPDPKATYAVPIAGSAFKGSEHAKITVVEAFEFA